ncbi:DUF2637 domain-containing protein, partial [Actinomadura adrarensis]
MSLPVPCPKPSLGGVHVRAIGPRPSPSWDRPRLVLGLVLGVVLVRPGLRGYAMMRRLGAAVADSGPVLILAAIAAAGSFTHIRDTAAEHGQGGWMAWAIAVCIDLTCVMAARERQRDRLTGRETARLS